MRMTRAALRAQESEETLRDQLNAHLEGCTTTNFDSNILIHEDSDKENSMVAESEAKSMDIEQSPRKALKDITDQPYPNAEMAEPLQPERSMSKKSKKGRTKVVKETIGQQKENSLDASHETTEQVNCGADIDSSDVSVVTAAPAATELQGTKTPSKNVNLEATNLILSPGLGQTTTQSGSDNTPLKDQSPRGKIATILRTPRFDPETYARISPGSISKMHDVQDSFVEAIKARTPSKSDRSDNETADSFVENILSRTPARLTSSPRVEDSVVALDALEDAIEKISEDLPALGPALVPSPSKTKASPSKSALKVSVHPRSRSPQKPLSPTKNKMSGTESKPTAPRLSVKDRIKAFETKPPVSSHRRATSVVTAKSVSIAPAKVTKKPTHAASKSVVVAPSKPMVSLTQSPAKPQQNMVKKRVPSGPLSTSKPGFVPIKSTKPLTKSAFVLPGDAIAAKLKAQREERLKKEEEASKKKEFKARPAPVMTAGPSFTPRENKASQARMKRMSGENKENVAPARSTAPKTTVTTTKTRPTVNQPNSSVRRTSPVTSSSTNPVGGLRVTSNESVKSTSSQTSIAPVTKVMPRGKEAFDRQRLTVTDAQRERKEKEEAAKKARAEAAERGRQASRDWAEKQKRKLMAEKEAKLKAQEAIAA